MSCHRRMVVAVCVFAASLLVPCDRAAGFNPQPEPPGGQWRVEGFIDMWAMGVGAPGDEMPFGIDRTIAGDDVVDFSAGVIARFDASTTDDGKPVDGRYQVEFEHFLLRIGDTTWDQTMPGEMMFQVAGGVVNGCYGGITLTKPEHPDLSFAWPSSPGTWRAKDERNGVNLGVVEGRYSLRDGVVPEPSTLVLLVLAVAGLAWWHRRA